jgi:hypothetical protein
MKLLLTIICIAFVVGLHAQTSISKSYPTQSGQKINLKFDYPIIKISTWIRNEVSVIAHVKINENENYSAFSLDEQIIDGVMTISGHIKDMDKLPRRYTIVRDGKKTIFKSKEEYLASQKKGGIQQAYEDSDIDIVLEINMPEQAITDIESIYGIVEITNFNAPVTIDAKYGGIDATLVTEHTGNIKVTTRFGQLLTNLDLHLTDHVDRDFFHSITAEPGKGPSYNFTSTFGKIYLRKP